MKKLFCLLLIAMALCSLAACGREKDKGAAAADSADNQAPESSVSQKQPSEKNRSLSLQPLNQRKAQTVLMLTSQGLAVQWYIPKSII